jgi:hypothetical protein
VTRPDRERPAEDSAPGAGLPPGTVRDALLGVAARTCPVPGDARARLLAAYERRGAPASRWRVLLGGGASGDRSWAPATLSAVAAACLVVVGGALTTGGPASSAPDASGGGVAGRIGPAGLTGMGPTALRTAGLRPGERALAFSDARWQAVHPLPSRTARVRLVNDQNLSLIGVGWTPDLEGP